MKGARQAAETAIGDGTIGPADALGLCVTLEGAPLMIAAQKTQNQKPTKDEQDELDEALEESFPASDPPAPASPPTKSEELEQDKKKP